MNDLRAQNNKRLAFKLLLLVIAMVAFSLALIPLYDVITDASGINGKIKGSVAVESLNFKVDKARLIRLDLITSIGRDTPIKFTVEPQKLQVHPGQIHNVNYVVQNLSNKAIKLHANPSVSPGLAAAQVKMSSCFCFDNQQLEAGETKQLDMRFVIDPLLPVQYKNIALAQQFFTTK